MLTQYRVLTEWLEEHKRAFLTAYTANVTYFRSEKGRRRPYPPVKIRSLLTFYPNLPAGSELQLDWKVEAVSASDLAAIVVNESTPRVNLSDAEISALARLLNLTPWAPMSTPAALTPAQSPVETGESPYAPVVVSAPHAISNRWRHFQLAVTESLIVWLTGYCQHIRFQLDGTYATPAADTSENRLY
jgi:hypothetical protein